MKQSYPATPVMEITQTTGFVQQISCRNRFTVNAPSFYLKRKLKEPYIINPSLCNVVKWLDTLEKFCSICCKIIKVYLTILRHCEINSSLNLLICWYLVTLYYLWYSEGFWVFFLLRLEASHPCGRVAVGWWAQEDEQCQWRCGCWLSYFFFSIILNCKKL